MSKKQKRERTIVISLVAVLVVVIAAYFIAVKQNEKKQKAADTSVQLLHLDTSKASKIEINNTHGTFVFEKKDGQWIMPSDENFEVSDEGIGRILDIFSGLIAKRCVVENKDTLSEYGLDKPEIKTTMTLSDGTTECVSLGMTVPSTDEYYGMIDGKDGVYLLTANSVMNLDLELDMFNANGADQH